MTEPQPTPESFLRLIDRDRRGRLKVYLGYGPGVGKTYAMLLEAHRLKAQGVDVVVGYVEDHGRADTASLLLGLETVPRRVTHYRGVRLEEMDTDAVLARRPRLALVDELAHTNVPGSPRPKRYQDVLALLEAGVHVLTTLNVQHLESLYDTVERLVGVRVKERVPDWVVAEADEVVNVDLAADDLLRRLEEGKVYPRERLAAALANYFQKPHLEHLRGLTLREAASQLERRGRAAPVAGAAEAAPAPEQVVVCLASKGPDALALLRYGSRLAGRFDRSWYALYVQTPAEEPTRIEAATQRHLGSVLALAHQLGATVFTYRDPDVVGAILRFAREYRAGHLVVGRGEPRPWWRRLGRRSVVERLIARARGFTVVVVDPHPADRTAPLLPPPLSHPREGAPPPAPEDPAAAVAGRAAAPARPEPPPRLTDLLDERALLLLDRPVTKDELLPRLVAAAAAGDPRLDRAEALRRLTRREAEGSTFLEAGIGLPHARVPGLARPLAALAVLGRGLADSGPGDAAVEVVVLLLCPDERPEVCLALLAAGARLFREPGLRRELVATAAAGSPATILARLARAEG
jgi:two-component system sensor histidine kinase KdpD